MSFQVNKTVLKEILPLRTLFLQENNFQVRYHACHERGWTDSYSIHYNDDSIGYGAVKGLENLADRDTVFEFYLLPSFRHLALPAFSTLLQVSGASFIECQSNDVFLTTLFYQFAHTIRANAILFEDKATTFFSREGIVFRKRSEMDIVFAHQTEPVGEYVLEQKAEIVASGGFALHYNRPFADLYMEVKEDYRKNGLGSYLVQELKKACYLAGRVPAARCAVSNLASQKTLLKAGFGMAGFLLAGSVR